MIYISLFLGFYIALPLDMPIHCFLVAIVFCEVSLTVGFSVFNQVIFFHVCVFVCVCCICMHWVHVHVYVLDTCSCVCVHAYEVCIHAFCAWSHVHVCMHACVLACHCVWSPRLISRVFLDESLPCSLRPGLWIALRAHWSGWPGWPFAAGIPCLSFPSGGNAGYLHHLLLTWFLGYLDSGAYAASPLHREPCARPLNSGISVVLYAFLLLGIPCDLTQGSKVLFNLHFSLFFRFTVCVDPSLSSPTLLWQGKPMELI